MHQGPRRADELLTATGEKPDPEAVRTLLRSWMTGDEKEQRETSEALKAGLNEGRPPELRHFP